MKIINLNESQYTRLFEMDSFVRTGGDDGGQSSIADYQTHDEVVNTSKIHDKDGSVIDSEPKDTQAKQDQMSHQEWGSRTNRNSTNTI